MGKLIRNGIEYGGGNGTDIFEVDQDTYDALVQAGTLTGSETLTLPTGWNEALHGGTNPYRFINGCGQTSDNHQAIWTLGGYNKVGLQMWKYNGTDYISTSSLLVYYR